MSAIHRSASDSWSAPPDGGGGGRRIPGELRLGGSAVQKPRLDISSRDGPGKLETGLNGRLTGRLFRCAAGNYRASVCSFRTTTNAGLEVRRFPGRLCLARRTRGSRASGSSRLLAVPLTRSPTPTPFFFPPVETCPLPGRLCSAGGGSPNLSSCRSGRPRCRAGPLRSARRSSRSCTWWGH